MITGLGRKTQETVCYRHLSWLHGMQSNLISTCQNTLNCKSCFIILHYEQKNYQEELTEAESFGFVADDTEDFAGFLSLGVLNLGIIRQLFFNSYRMFVTGHQLTTYMTVNKITNKHYK